MQEFEAVGEIIGSLGEYEKYFKNADIFADGLLSFDEMVALVKA